MAGTYRLGPGAQFFPFVLDSARGHELLEEGEDQHGCEDALKDRGTRGCKRDNEKSETRVGD